MNNQNKIIKEQFSLDLIKNTKLLTDNDLLSPKKKINILNSKLTQNKDLNSESISKETDCKSLSLPREIKTRGKSLRSVPKIDLNSKSNLNNIQSNTILSNAKTNNKKSLLSTKVYKPRNSTSLDEERGFTGELIPTKFIPTKSKCYDTFNQPSDFTDSEESESDKDSISIDTMPIMKIDDSTEDDSIVKSKILTDTTSVSTEQFTQLSNNIKLNNNTAIENEEQKNSPRINNKQLLKAISGSTLILPDDFINIKQNNKDNILSYSDGLKKSNSFSNSVIERNLNKQQSRRKRSSTSLMIDREILEAFQKTNSADAILTPRSIENLKNSGKIPNKIYQNIKDQKQRNRRHSDSSKLVNNPFNTHELEYSKKVSKNKENNESITNDIGDIGKEFSFVEENQQDNSKESEDQYNILSGKLDHYGFDVLAECVVEYEKWFNQYLENEVNDIREEFNRYFSYKKIERLKKTSEMRQSDFDMKKKDILYKKINIKKAQQLSKLNVPIQWRKKIWCYFMNVGSSKKDHTDYYKNLLENKDQCDEKTKNQILLDLQRTFPNYNNDKKFLEKLKNILFCFAKHNKGIGYAQSMNFIVASFLIFIDGEEETFYCLKYVAEILLPGYFNESQEMSGVRRDVLIMQKYIQMYIGNVYNHLIKYNMDIKLVFNQWFSSLFFLNLPKETVFRIWDKIFIHGIHKLFEYSCKIILWMSEQIISTKNETDLIVMMFNQPQKLFDFNKLEQYELDPPIESSHINYMRMMIDNSEVLKISSNNVK